MMGDQMEIGDRLKSLRIDADLTQQEVANRLGIRKRSYQHHEANETRPTYENLVALADLYKVTTDYLLGRVQ